MLVKGRWRDSYGSWHVEWSVVSATVGANFNLCIFAIADGSGQPRNGLPRTTS